MSVASTDHKFIHVVARSRQIHRELGKVMFAMSSCKATTYSGSLTSLVLAREIIAMCSFGFYGYHFKEQCFLSL